MIVARTDSSAVAVESTAGGRARASEHIVELDGVRGLAIALVLELHSIAGALGPLRPFTGAGWVGVDLFFVLSGFLITRILRSALGSAHFFRNFYARRALRIWPLYYVIVAFAFAGTRLLPEGYRISTERLPFYLTFTQNLIGAKGFGPWAVAVTWSLAIEEQFYFLWPLCVRFFGSRKLVTVLLLVLIIMPVGRFLALTSGVVPNTIYTTTWFRIDALAAGALAAILVDSPLRRTVQRFSVPVAVVSLTLGAILSVALLKGDVLILAQTPIRGFLAFGYAATFSVIALGFAALVVLAASDEPSLLRQVLRNGALRYLGKVGFGLYLIQGIMVPVAQVFFRSWLAGAGLSGKGLSAVVVALALLATFSLAELSWRFLETPVLRLRRLFPAREPRAASTTGRETQRA